MKVNKRTIPAMVSMALIAASTALYTPFALSSTLTEAAKANDIAQSRELINAGADVNLAEPDGTTALLWAVYNKSSAELVELLLDSGADANAANQLDITPLLQASRYGDAEIISTLLANGANHNSVRYGVESAIMAAARSGNVDAIETLLDAGANPELTGSLYDQTAIMWAAADGHIDAVQLLIDAGADMDATSRVSELSKRVNADFPTGGFAALHWAARNGDIAMINLLAENGADLNVTNGDGATPMILAIVNDRFDIANTLLELGTDANDGSLYFITEMRDSTHDWLAQDGTRYRSDYENDLSALDFTRILLEAGADPNLPISMQLHSYSMCCDTTAKSTPFFRAAIAADVEGLELMLAHGADTEWRLEADPTLATDPNLIPQFGRNDIGKSALMAAITGGNGVGRAGGPGDLRVGEPPFREVSNREPANAVNVLLAANAKVDVRDRNDDTALHIAAFAGQIEIVRALVENGASLNAENKDGYTPQQLVENKPARMRRTDRFSWAPIASPDQIIALLEEFSSQSEEY